MRLPQFPLSPKELSDRCVWKTFVQLWWKWVWHLMYMYSRCAHCTYMQYGCFSHMKCTECYMMSLISYWLVVHVYVQCKMNFIDNHSQPFSWINLHVSLISVSWYKNITTFHLLLIEIVCETRIIARVFSYSFTHTPTPFHPTLQCLPFHQGISVWRSYQTTPYLWAGSLQQRILLIVPSRTASTLLLMAGRESLW